ncbi:MAG: TIGR01777 family oxidoreductase [Actinomycetota bacterium]|nr:TIGR01777 family oxidoreductase [Actinomycetota bacterium]
MHIVLGGASGLIGAALAKSLRRDGHEVTSLVRRVPRTVEEKQWGPQDGKLDPAALAGADAAVCLSGAGIADRRWTESYKRTLLASRSTTVGTIARTIASIGSPPVFVCASAVGYYGDTGEREVDESAPRGDGFLAELCEQWEQAAQPAVEAGVRVAHLRTGIVLTKQGGFLKRLAPIVRLGLGGRLGSGKQFLPWISLADEVAAIRFVMDHDLHGAVNVTGPEPTRNGELISKLADLMHRPAVIPVPAFAIKVALGELAGSVLGGQRAVPTALQGAGFLHQHPDVESALAWALAN